MFRGTLRMLVAKADNTIGTENVRFMARRATTNVVEVNALHVAMTSKPGVVGRPDPYGGQGHVLNASPDGIRVFSLARGRRRL